MTKQTAIQPGKARHVKPVLSDADFKKVAAIAYTKAGLAIAPSKAAMVHTRLARRLRALQMNSYTEYCALVESNEGKSELREFISALTTNVSHFFREDHHFDRLREEVLPELLDKLQSGMKVRIWSAGCSNGQEPFSIATLLLENGPLPPGADLKILATDIDPKVITFAKAGVYDKQMIAGLPETLRSQFFNPVDTGRELAWQANPQLKELIAFKELNLLDQWPMKGRFDVIFCRNVVIYFDEPTQKVLWQKFSDVMDPGSWLFLGHSERVSDEFGSELPSVGMTTYRRAPLPLERTTAPTPHRKD